jgi:hypothetical protein
MNTTAIVYATVIFLALVLGGLMVLRTQRTAGTRATVFLLFTIGCVVVTLAATKRWQLLMGEAALAWIMALLILGAIAGVERALRRTRR